MIIPRPFVLVIMLLLGTSQVAVSGAHIVQIQGLLDESPAAQDAQTEHTAQRAPSSATSLTQPESGSAVFVGELLIAEGHSPDRRIVKYAYYLREIAGNLTFIEFTDLKPLVSDAGKRVEVYGQKISEARRIVTSAAGYRILGPSPLSQEIAQVTGPQNYVTLLNKFTDVGTEPQNAVWFSNMIYGATGSTVNTYFQEDSYGLISYAGAAFGWSFLSTYARTYSGLVNHGAADRAHFLTGGATGTCGPNDDGSCLGDILQHSVATFDSSVYFAAYGQGINLELNANIGCCAWGTVGNWGVSTDDGYLSRGVIWMPPWAQTVGIHGHENGHAIGWIHSGLNYDDSWSQMSGGIYYSCPYSPVYTAGGCPSHSHGQEKEEQGWIPSGSVLTVSQGTVVTVDLKQLETSSSGTMLVKMQVPCTMVSWSTGGTCRIYLEARKWHGFDGYLPGEGVIITKYTTQTASGDWKLRPVLRGGSMSTAHYRVGDVYSEGDVRVEVVSSGADYFRVTVTYGPITVTATSTVTSTVWSTSYSYVTTTRTSTSYTDTSTSTSTVPVLTTVVLVPLTVTSTLQSTEYVTSTRTATLTSYTATEASTNTVTVPTTVILVPLTATSTLESTQYVTSIHTTTLTSYIGTEASTSTVLISTTVVLVPYTATSVIDSTQYLTSIRTTRVTSYVGTEASTSTVWVPTTVILLPYTTTSTVESTEYVTSVLATTVTSYTATSTSTSTTVVYTTVTETGGQGAPGQSPALPQPGYSALICLGFLGITLTSSYRRTMDKVRRIPKLRALGTVFGISMKRNVVRRRCMD